MPHDFEEHEEFDGDKTTRGGSQGITSENESAVRISGRSGVVVTGFSVSGEYRNIVPQSRHDGVRPVVIVDFDAPDRDGSVVGLFEGEEAKVEKGTAEPVDDFIESWVVAVVDADSNKKRDVTVLIDLTQNAVGLRSVSFLQLE